MNNTPDRYQFIRDALHNIVPDNELMQNEELLDKMMILLVGKQNPTKTEIQEIYFTQYRKTMQPTEPDPLPKPDNTDSNPDGNDTVEQAKTTELQHDINAAQAAPLPTPDVSPPAINTPGMAPARSGKSIKINPKGTPRPAPAPAPRPLMLPNAKQGEPYEYVMEWEKLDIAREKLIDCRFSGLEAAGLKFDLIRNVLSGVPLLSGDMEFTIFFRMQNTAQFERKALLYVNPDPRSLWTEQEPPADAPYAKPHTDTLLHTQGPKTFVAAAKRGRSHAKDGKFRDDDFAFHYNELSGWYVIAVSDGAGSAQYSREGSRLACHTAVDLLHQEPAYLQLLDRLGHYAQSYQQDAQNSEAAGELQKVAYKILVDAATQGYKRIEAEAAAREGARAKDYAATLLLTICKKFHFGWFVGAFWVGDGAIGVYTRGTDAPVLMGEPDSGEYSGQTRFLTMPEIFEGQEPWKRLRMKFFEGDFDALTLMTDGVSDPKFQTEARMKQQPAWDVFFDEIAGKVNLSRDNKDLENELLSWLDFWEKGEYDDRTLAILF